MRFGLADKSAKWKRKAKTQFIKPLPQDWWFATQPKTAIAIILGTGKATSYGLHIWPIHSQGSSEQKPMKNLGEKGAWAYPGTAQFFWVPPISRTGLRIYTNFKFCIGLYPPIFLAIHHWESGAVPPRFLEPSLNLKEQQWQIPDSTRQLSYRKDNRAMRLYMSACPENFPKSLNWVRPRLFFPKFLMGLC